MSGGDPRHDWMRQYAEGAAAAETTARLEQALREDAVFRKFFLEYLNVDLALAATAAHSELTDGNAKLIRFPKTTRRAVVAWAMAAAIILFLGLAAEWWWPEQSIVTLAQSSGAVSWSAERGELRRAMQPGARLRAGTLHVEGAQSSAQLVFLDGTRATLCGESEAAFSENAQKILALRTGALTVEARPQPAGHPLLVRTPMAEVEVLGTRFSLTHEPGQTLLAVEEGKVRLTRLADRRVAVVTADQTVTATLDATATMEVRNQIPAPTRWRQTFAQAPPPVWQGQWLPPDATQPGRMRNVLDVSSRKSDGTVAPVYVVSAQNNSGGLATVQPKSVLRLRLRTAKPVNLVVLVGLRKHDGDFAGTFQADFQPEDVHPDPAGWCQLQIPMTKLKAGMKDYPMLPPEGWIFLVYVACYFPEGGLEVSEASIGPPPAL